MHSLPLVTRTMLRAAGIFSSLHACRGICHERGLHALRVLLLPLLVQSAHLANQ
jgi:hypothetical protein